MCRLAEDEAQRGCNPAADPLQGVMVVAQMAGELLQSGFDYFCNDYRQADYEVMRQRALVTGAVVLRLLLDLDRFPAPHER
jgi:hypothetical protein